MVGQGETEPWLSFNPEGRSERRGDPQTHHREIQSYINSMVKLFFGSEIRAHTFIFMSVFQN